MTIKTALNRIALSILLEKNPIWETEGNVKILRSTTQLNFKSNPMQLTRAITKTISSANNDLYYFNSTLQNRVGHVILTHELRIMLPHSDGVLTDELTPEELIDFIIINEESNDNHHTHWIGNHDYDNDIIKQAEAMFGKKEKGNVKTIK